MACKRGRIWRGRGIAWVPVDLCQWVISCASGLRACDDSCVWQKMRACVHYCMRWWRECLYMHVCDHRCTLWSGSSTWDWVNLPLLNRWGSIGCTHAEPASPWTLALGAGYISSLPMAPPAKWKSHANQLPPPIQSTVLAAANYPLSYQSERERERWSGGGSVVHVRETKKIYRDW